MPTTLERDRDGLRYECSVHRSQHGPTWRTQTIPGWFCPICAREQAAALKQIGPLTASGNGWEVLNG